VRLNEPVTVGQSISVNGATECLGAIAPGESLPFDYFDLEAIATNLEESLRVHNNHQFFNWIQGSLQSLVRHEALICALRKDAGELSMVESFSLQQPDHKLSSQRYPEVAAVLAKLIKEWEGQRCQPLLRDASSHLPFADSAMHSEFKRNDVNKVIAHGTHDMSGKAISFFIFACRARDANDKQARQVEMLVPFLHSAWIRSKLFMPVDAGEDIPQSNGHGLLTLREEEVLSWVYLGKSNIEIGVILGISALTVKNHVQEILRRLNVQNRTQAVGKAFKLHILTC
jgi:transcriptional regulator EpsA